VAEAAEVCELEFSSGLLEEIRARIAQDEQLTRSELSREVCRRQGWRSANSGQRELTCRLALLELERRGELELPLRRSGLRRACSAKVGDGELGEDLRCELRELGELELVGVRASEDRGLSELWNVRWTPFFGPKMGEVKVESAGWMKRIGLTSGRFD